VQHRSYYCLFVGRKDDGEFVKISLPLYYVYGFVCAALVGVFTIAGLVASYTRVLLKTEKSNQLELCASTTSRWSRSRMSFLYCGALLLFVCFEGMQ
jgi:NADH:ubiquinone oxidoreductase subunit 3 (subunit A)